MRDAQKAKVYAAEFKLRRHTDLFSSGVDPGSAQDIDPKLDHESARALLDHVGSVAQDHPDTWIAQRARKQINLTFPTKGSIAFYRETELRLISLPPWALRTSVLLHEYAHHLTYRAAPNHGALFASRFLDLLDVHAPACLPILRAAYDDGGVRYLPVEETKRILAYAKKVRQESRSATGELPYVQVLAEDRSQQHGTRMVFGYLVEVDATGIVVTHGEDTDLVVIPRTDLLALSQSDRYYRP